MSCATAVDFYRWENSLVGKLARKHYFHVAGSLELFEYDFVHPAPRLDQRGADDRKTSTLFNIPRRTEESLRLDQRVRVNTSREYLSAVGYRRVVCPGEAGYTVKQNNDIVFRFDQSLCLLEFHFCARSV